MSDMRLHVRLQASYGGLGYRFSKDLNDKDTAGHERLMEWSNRNCASCAMEGRPSRRAGWSAGLLSFSWVETWCHLPWPPADLPREAAGHGIRW